MKEYVISDTHFYHHNIIKYCGRPYQSVEEMNRDLVERWNGVVTDADIVYFVGDFGFGDFLELKHILNQLNGSRLICFLGNHDKSVQQMYEMGWSAVLEEAVIKTYYGKVLFRHYPVELQSRIPIDVRGCIHGHIHEKKNFVLESYGNINVSADVTDFKPMLLSQALGQLKNINR